MKEMYQSEEQYRKGHCSLWLLSPGNKLKRLWKRDLKVQKKTLQTFKSSVGKAVERNG